MNEGLRRFILKSMSQGDRDLLKRTETLSEDVSFQEEQPFIGCCCAVGLCLFLLFLLWIGVAIWTPPQRHGTAYVLASLINTRPLLLVWPVLVFALAGFLLGWIPVRKKRLMNQRSFFKLLENRRVLLLCSLSAKRERILEYLRRSSPPLAGKLMDQIKKTDACVQELSLEIQGSALAVKFIQKIGGNEVENQP